MELQGRKFDFVSADGNTEYEAPWIGVVSAIGSAGLAFILYWWTAAPDLTWAHQGADGGDFLAAAITGGVPHPSGYPLYTLLLQLWLRLSGFFTPDVSIARSGNLLSALLAALGVGLTVSICGRLLHGGRAKWPLAIAIGMLWAIAPQLWSQSLITEVYTLHMLLVILLVWAVLLHTDQPVLIGVVAGLGLTNHLTFALLLPAVAYILWRRKRRAIFNRYGVIACLSAAATIVALYARIPYMAGRTLVSPVNWGYADNWSGFWWLVSGNAYRHYFADQALGDIGARIAVWARTITLQYTAVGLALAAVGFASWDRERPNLRTLSLLWIVPVSVYSILYNTKDSQVYLLPVGWMMALWITSGLAASVSWFAKRYRVPASRISVIASAVLLVGVIALAASRVGDLSLRRDHEARGWLDTVIENVEPNSIIVSSSDEETFALWYGAWASGELLEQAPNLVVVNDSLYQFDWYRRLQGDLHPTIPGADEGFSELLMQNANERPIYFVEFLDTVPEENQEAHGDIWRFVP